MITTTPPTYTRSASTQYSPPVSYANDPSMAVGQANINGVPSGGGYSGASPDLIAALKKAVAPQQPNVSVPPGQDNANLLGAAQPVQSNIYGGG